LFLARMCSPALSRRMKRQLQETMEAAAIGVMSGRIPPPLAAFSTGVGGAGISVERREVAGTDVERGDGHGDRRRWRCW
jgi:hypothetical protein